MSKFILFLKCVGIAHVTIATLVCIALITMKMCDGNPALAFLVGMTELTVFYLSVMYAYWLD